MGSRVRVSLSNKRPRVAGRLYRRDRSALQNPSGHELLTEPAPGEGSDNRKVVWDGRKVVWLAGWLAACPGLLAELQSGLPALEQNVVEK